GHDGDLGAGPRAHHPGRHRFEQGARRPRPARAHLPAPRAARRCAATRRPDRGCRGPCPPRRTQSRGGRLRDHARGWDDGPNPDLIPYCERHGIKMITVEDLIEYRRQTEKLVERMTSVRLPTAYGDFTAVAFRETLTGKHHVALVKGNVEGEEDVLVRVHSECLTGDVFHS